MRIASLLLWSCFPAAFLLASAVPANAAGLFDRPADDRTLDAIRGGFSPPGGGLILSFAVQRSVYVDGVLAAAANDSSTLLLVQRGLANSVGAGIGDAIVLQNSVSGTRLQAVTTIDIVANSQQLFLGAALQTSMRNSLIDSLRR
ncbi:MAG: hypothetical protein ABI781_11240 [Burkholderiales bacterium]